MSADQALQQAVDQVSEWPVDHAAVSVVQGGDVAATFGDQSRPFALASVSKLVSALTIHVALEEGSLHIDCPVPVTRNAMGTIRQLLAHASGLPFDEPITTAELIERPETKRIYSNTGFERLGQLLSESTGMRFGDYLREAVTDPLGMRSTNLVGSPASGVESSCSDLVRFVGEIRKPSLVSAQTINDMCTEQFPALVGIVPGFGSFSPCPWGLGPEIKGAKGSVSPHWTGTRPSARTWGHFGAAGTFVWVDPEIDLAVVMLTDRPFGPWARVIWPAWSDAIHLAASGKN